MPRRGRLTRASISAAKSKRATAWALKPFTSSARRDNPGLKHWVRAHAEFTDYPFAKFNRKVDIVRYTDEEYSRLCTPASGADPSKDQDARWGRDQTDKLFELARQFDLRWALIHDRWPLRPSRTIEDMKLRFYTVTVRVIAARRSGRGSYSASSVAQVKQYDGFEYRPAADSRRRKQLDAAYRRSPEEIAEEASLRAEVKAIDAALAAARTAAAKAAGKGGATALAAAVALGMKKPPAGSDMGPTFAASYSGDASAAAAAAATSGTAGSAHEVLAHQGVALRSEQLAAVLPGYVRASRTMKKVTALMHELGVPPAGKLLPCAAVYAAHTKLRQDTVTLFQLQRAVAAAEQRVQGLTSQRRSLANTAVKVAAPLQASGGAPQRRR